MIFLMQNREREEEELFIILLFILIDRNRIKRQI
jgi:hypothetical protein